jgi:hypothetical protein
LAPLMVLIVLIGVMPGPFLDRLRPSLAEIDRNLQEQRLVIKAPESVPVDPGVGSISAPKNNAGMGGGGQGAGAPKEGSQKGSR